MERKILVIDDEPSILEIMRIILEEAGFKVKTLDQAKNFYEVVLEYQPNLILLDLWMPEIDGWEITKKLKEESETKNIPVIVVSAVSHAEEVAQKSGANDFLQKPFEIEDLLKHVRKYLPQN